MAKIIVARRAPGRRGKKARAADLQASEQAVSFGSGLTDDPAQIRNQIRAISHRPLSPEATEQLVAFLNAPPKFPTAAAVEAARQYRARVTRTTKKDAEE